MVFQEQGPVLGSKDLRKDIRSAAHDLNNLLYRLEILADTMRGDRPALTDWEETREMVLDTKERLAGLVDRLRRLASGES